MTTVQLVVRTARLRFDMLRLRLSQQRHQVTSAALVLGGMAGALGGGALIGRWALGLVLIVESVACVWIGMERDDGAPVPPRPGTLRTPAEINEMERYRPDPPPPDSDVFDGDPQLLRTIGEINESERLRAFQ